MKENSLSVLNVFSALQEAKLDPIVKIKIASVAGDASMRLHATSLGPLSRVSSHYHQEGSELYFILSGEGEMYTGKPVEGGVEWNQPRAVRTGDSFSIPEKTVHQLKNTSPDSELVLLFVCPDTHLSTDRSLAKDY